MKKKIIVLALFSVIFCASCNDGFLDRTPYDGLSSAVIWDNDANALMAINGIYSTYAQETHNPAVYYYTVVAPEGYAVVRGANGVSHITGLATNRDPMFLSMYRGWHRPIRYANDAIAGLENNSNITPELASRMIGEAKFFRGLCYFYIWQLWGSVPLITTPIPPDETALPRSPEEDIKAQIIADLTDAANRLPVNYTAATDLGRVTQGAAIAMLGKMFLFDRQWDRAAAELGKLLTGPYAYNLVPEFADNFRSGTQNNRESVFELQYVDAPNLGNRIDRWFGTRVHKSIGQDYAEASQVAVDIFTNTDGTPINKSSRPVRADYPDEASYGPVLVDWYETTFANADPRLHKSIILPGATYVGIGDVEYKYYWPTGSANDNPPAIRTTFTDMALLPIRKLVSIGEELITRDNSSINYPVIRFADVLLMYAEAVNEASGPSASAYDAVNRVRNRAGIANLPAGLSQEGFRTEVRLERFKELLFEMHNYFDVKRWRTAHTSDPVFGLNHQVLDFRYEPILTRVFLENKDYLWPIPGEEIDLNPLLTQNPGWE